MTLLDEGIQDNQNAKFLQIEQEFIRYKIDILGVSEARWLGSGTFNSPTGRSVFIYSGNEAGSNHERGVGLLLTPTAHRSMMSWAPISERIMTARFRSKIRNITIIQCYAPTEKAEASDKDDFYSQLTNAYNSAPRGDIIFVMGDLNAKVGQDNTLLTHVIGKHGLGDRNDNGERFLDFCNMNHLVIGGTIFRHKTCHKVSWVSPDGVTQNQIDHIAMSRRFRGCLLDVRNKRGADKGVLHDHHLMVATVRLRTAAVKRDTLITRRTPKYFTERLQNPVVAAAFRKQINERTNNINTSPTVSATQHWEAIKTIYRTAGDEVVGRPPRGHRPWMSDKTWASIQERVELKARIEATSSDDLKRELKAQYREKQRDVKRNVRHDKRSHINALAQSAEDAANMGNISGVYKITKQLVNSNQFTTERPIKALDGRLLSTDEEQQSRWRSHFSSVLNHLLTEDASQFATRLPQLSNNNRIPTTEPSLSEVRDAIKWLPNNKAAGVDGIPAEFFKCHPEKAAELLCPLISTVWNNESFPSDWTEGIIVKIPKKGDLRLCDNWRGICVLPAVSKIVAKVILERLKQALYATIDAEQAGFRPGSSCTDHVNTLRIMIEQCAEFNTDLHMVFIDFAKAFDSINRDCIWAALQRRGVPDKIIAVIRATYEGANCRVLHKGKLSEVFEINSGVRQGCILSPVLFLLVIGDVLSSTLQPHVDCGVRWSLFSRLQHLDYADDICFMAHSIPELNKMVRSLEVEASFAGLKINCGKTKVMSLAQNQSGSVTVADQQVEAVDQFTYLGSELAAYGGTDLDVESRIKKARAAFGMLSIVWRNNNLSTSVKIRLFKSNVLSVLLYGCCTWKVTESVTNRLQVFVNRCLRNIFRIYWPNRITNDELHRRANMEPIDIRIRRLKWSWIGHTLRKEEGCIARKAMEWNPMGGGSRKRGRPRQTWRRTVEGEARAGIGKSWSELKTIAKNRTRWRVGVVDALCPARD